MNRRRTLLDWLRTGVWFWTSTLTFAVLMYPRVRNLVLGVEVSRAERGYQVAINAGCFNRKHHPSAPACIRPHGSDVAPMTMQQPPRASGELARRCMA
ncbi:MAG: hypothetical protein DMF95_31195 [Acidobacteria bacterium]|nr:MAG: hypothetical protein DMF95_31195 [Acidobacteriota bacterium]